MKRYKRLYDTMMETGELQEIFPSMSGQWEKDKTRFIQQQDELEKLANITYGEDED